MKDNINIFNLSIRRFLLTFSIPIIFYELTLANVVHKNLPHFPNFLADYLILIILTYVVFRYLYDVLDRKNYIHSRNELKRLS